jgi:hypothetical protein
MVGKEAPKVFATSFSGHPAIDRRGREHPQPEIFGVWFHALSFAHGSTLVKTAVRPRSCALFLPWSFYSSRSGQYSVPDSYVRGAPYRWTLSNILANFREYRWCPPRPKGITIERDAFRVWRRPSLAAISHPEGKSLYLYGFADGGERFEHNMT